MYIRDIKAISVLDSRGLPTIKTFVYTDDCVASAIVPSGTSSGKNEAFELRDGGRKYKGFGVSKAVNNVNKKIAPKLKGEFVLDQENIDKLMIKLDGTNNKSNLGGNAILSVSLAVARAAALDLDMPLFQYIARLNSTSLFAMPIPLLNIINGGDHAGNNLAFQEFQIIPKAKTFEKTIQMSSEIYLTLKDIIKKKFGANAINVGYEGGFAPNISDPKIALDLIQNAIDKCKYSKDVTLGLDCAANAFYNPKKKVYTVDSKDYTYEKLSKYYLDLIKNYNLTSIEDPFCEDDKKGWMYFYKLAKRKINIIGDDLTVSNPKLIKNAIKKEYCNSLLLKVNQIGTVSECIKSFNIAKTADWDVITSHRSGDSEDPFIADLAFGLSSDYIKFGAPQRSERTAKYNRLLEIENL